MKSYATDRIRNVAVVGHGGTGKTSLVEAMLFAARAIDRLGRVDDGTTTTDYDPEEIRRKITINTGVAPLEWRDHKVNLLDTPGYPDFLGEVAAATRVADGALIIVDAVSGPEVQTEKAWAYAGAGGGARLFVVNRMDRENASFDRTVDALRARFGQDVVPLQLPVGSEAGFSGVVDLLARQAYTFENGAAREAAIPADLSEAAASARERVIEAAVEGDDALMERYLEGGELSGEEIGQSLRAGVASGRVAPVLVASAARQIGVPLVLDAVVTFVPGPAERGAIEARNPRSNETVSVEPNPAAPLAALVFKTMADPYVGKLSYFRVYSGTFRSDSQVQNVNRDHPERIGQLLSLRGKHQELVAEVVAGDIGAVAKLGNTLTNDTLAARERPVVIPPIVFPQPAIAMAIEARSRADEDKLGQALQRLAEEDPTFTVRRDPELKQTVVSGLGESHLEIIADRLKRKFGVEVTLHPPRVPYRETIKGRAQHVQGRYVKQTGGRGQYAVCFIDLEPTARGEGFEFVDRIFGGAIPNNFIPSVEKGVRRTMEEGIIAGYPVVDVRVSLTDGKYHPVDSSDIAFQIAGSMALKDAFDHAGPILLEPIVDLSVRIPDDLMGDVIGDLNGKRARITGMEPQGGGTTVVRAQVPQAEMLRYASDLRSMTGGRGSFEMSFSHYEEVPAHIAEKVKAQAAKQKEEAASR